MATIRDPALDYLRAHPGGADDDELTRPLDLRNRAQANQRCHQLVADSLVIRRRVGGKFRNHATGTQPAKAPVPRPVAAQPSQPHGAWHWEGNVQSRAAAYLQAQGYAIIRRAGTASHEQGKDLVAEKDGRELWVTAKGFPVGTDRTRPSTQAGHWFKDAFFEIVEWRGEDAQAELAMALPDFPRYRRLAERVRWLQRVARFSYLWVRRTGRCRASTRSATHLSSAPDGALQRLVRAVIWPCA